MRTDETVTIEGLPKGFVWGAVKAGIKASGKPDLAAAVAATVFVAATYWTVFALFGGLSLGARLAQAASSAEEEEEGEQAVRIR